MDKVAIIMPVYNSGEYLKYAVDSILNNTKYPFKLILVCSKSTDGTDEVCDNYAKDKRVEILHTEREGITKAINRGIDLAGDLDVYLTQDDVILPDLFKRDWLEFLANISKRKNCGMVSTISAGGTSGPSYLEGFKWIGTWSVYIPRSTINKIGKFDEEFSPGPGDDVDYTLRVISSGMEIYLANFWVDHHRRTENYNDSTPELNYKNSKYFRDKHKITPMISEFIFDNEKFMLNRLTYARFGCFGTNIKLDDPLTMQEIKNITTNFKKDDITLDVGTNTGMMSLVVQNGKVYAFEPSKYTYDILKANCDLNPHKNIIPMNNAVSDKEFNYKVKYGVLHKHGWSGMDSIEESEDGEKTITLDSLNLKNVKLIKIDTEGHDLRVLKGASKLLDTGPILITEDVKLDNEYLKSKGYKPSRNIGVGGINVLWEK